MKIKIALLAFVSAILPMFATAAPTTSPSVVEIAVAAEATSRQDIGPLIENLLTEATRGDTVQVFNVSGHARVASITISDNIPTDVTKNVKMKWLAKTYPTELRKIGAFLKAPALPDAAGGNANSIRYINALGLLAVEFPGRSIHAVYFGSPIVTVAPYSLVNRYPSDSFLLANDANLYSTVGRANALRGIDVHMIYAPSLIDFSTVDSAIHLAKIKRFYGLLLAQQGASLASFAGTTDHMKKISSTTFPQTSFGKPELGDGKLRMIEIKPATMLQEESAIQSALWASPHINVNPQPPNKPTGPIELAIKWISSNKGVDMDIYTQAGTDHELSYKSTRSEIFGGKHLKDIIESEQSGKEEFETVVYTGQVPINAVSVWINHYAGTTTAPVELEFRVRFENRIYAKRYRMQPGQGTRGGGDRNTSSSWVKISLPDVIGLRS